MTMNMNERITVAHQHEISLRLTALGWSWVLLRCGAVVSGGIGYSTRAEALADAMARA